MRNEAAQHRQRALWIAARSAVSVVQRQQAILEITRARFRFRAHRLFGKHIIALSPLPAGHGRPDTAGAAASRVAFGVIPTVAYHGRIATSSPCKNPKPDMRIPRVRRRATIGCVNQGRVCDASDGG